MREKLERYSVFSAEFTLLAEQILSADFITTENEEDDWLYNLMNVHFIKQETCESQAWLTKMVIFSTLNVPNKSYLFMDYQNT